LIHDPQPAGLAAMVGDLGGRVVWRCHVGTDAPSELGELGWTFLRRYLDPPAAEAYVFSRREFAPAWLSARLVEQIMPSIDPFAPKNQDLTADETEAILTAVGLLSGDAPSATYHRLDGTSRRVERGVDVVRA